MSDGHDDLVRRLTGTELGAAPFIEEQMAIESSNALRGAEIGLRGLRARPVLRRLWEGITGEGQERHAAIGQDLVVAQRATLSVVKTVMGEAIRTKTCVIRVLHNLHQVNEDVDELQELVPQIDARVTALRQELLAETKRLATDIENVKQLAVYLTRREAEVRRLSERYRANALHAGTGELLGATLFLAQHVRHFQSEPELVRAERSTAIAIIEDRLGKGVAPLAELVAQAVEGVSADARERSALVASAGEGPATSAIRMIFERELAGVRVDRRDIDDAVEIARRLHDPDGRLSANLLRPRELVEILADELDGGSKGDKR